MTPAAIQPLFSTLARRLVTAGAMSALVALTSLLTIELLRVFPALAVTQGASLDSWPSPFHVSIVVAPFIGAAATMAASGWIEPRRLMLAGGLTLALARLVAQVSHGEVLTVVAGVGLLAGLTTLALLALIGLPLFGGGVVAGAGLAAALRIALGSRDLMWIHHPAAVVTVVAITAWFSLFLVVRTRRPVELCGRSFLAALSLVALGPALLLEAFVLTNLGWVATSLDRGWLLSGFVIGAATGCGVAAAAVTAWVPGGVSRFLGLIGAVAVVALAAAHNAPGFGWVVPIAVAQVGLGSLLTAMSARVLSTGTLSPPLFMLAGGHLFLLGTIVALDGRGLLGFTVHPSTAVAVSGAVLAAAAAGTLTQPVPAAHRAGWRHVPSLAGVFVLPAVLLLAGLPLLASTGRGVSAGDIREVRVATYNVNLGFAENGSLNLVEVARVLGRANPDVVTLQEVPRGFLPTGGVDMLGWLQASLEMPYVAFQSSSPGSLHGNAVLSRYPIKHTELRRFPRRGTALPRGVIGVTLDLPQGEDLLVIASHFPPGGSPTDRRIRSATLLSMWDGRPRTVVGIDANAGPQSAIVTGLVEGGLELVESEELTFPASVPRAQIDFILHSPDLEAISVEVPQSRASDHRPVIAVIRPRDLF